MTDPDRPRGLPTAPEWPPAGAGVDAGLLVLRVGAGVTLALLFAWGEFPHAAVAGVSGHPAVVGAVVLLGLLATVGLAARPVAALMAAVMTCSMIGGWQAGQQFLQEPVRALMFVVLYGALSMTGPGAWSLDAWRERVASARLREPRQPA